MMARIPTADWECGQLSAHLGIVDRSEWQRDNGVIDGAEFATRLAAVQDAYVVMSSGDSPVSPSIRALSEAAKDGITEDNAAFTSAMDDAMDACDAADSLVSVDMLPEMGG